MTRNFKSYSIGFTLSLLLTLAAYFAVQIHVSSEHSIISHAILLPLIFAFAIAQFVAQLFFFLHLGSGERWKLGVFASTIGLVLIVVVGSIWIMSHLNYNMMASPAQVEHYMQDQQGGF